MADNAFSRARANGRNRVEGADLAPQSAGPPPIDGAPGMVPAGETGERPRVRRIVAGI
jgi:hypothetical protein